MKSVRTHMFPRYVPVQHLLQHRHRGDDPSLSSCAQLVKLNV